MPFTQGDPNINRTGLNKGSKKEKAFIEYYDEIAEDLAKENGMDVEEVKKIIYKVGYKKAKEGNYSFYKDILDRIHGTATNKTDMNVNANVTFTIAEKLATRLGLKEDDTTPNPEPSN